MRFRSFNLCQTLLGFDMRFHRRVWRGSEVFDRRWIPSFPDDRVQFRAEDEYRAGDIEEEEEYEHATERSVGAARVSDRQIETKPCRCQKPHDGRENRSGRNPPERQFNIRPNVIEDR